MKKFGHNHIPKGVKSASLNDLLKFVDKGVDEISKIYDKYNKMHPGDNLDMKENMRIRADETKNMLANLKRRSNFDKQIFKNKINTQSEQQEPIEEDEIIPRVDLTEYNNKIIKNAKPEDKFKLDNTGKLIIIESNADEEVLPEPIKKKEFTPPEKIPDLNLKEIYNYDTIQLVDVMRNLEYKKENLLKFVDLLAVIRRKSQLKIYDFPEIINALKFVKNNLGSIPQTYLVSLSYSLSKLQNFDPDRPSLDNDNLVYDILNHINADKLNVRTLSNLVYSLQTFQTKNGRIYNFNDYMTKLEVKIIDKMIKNPKSVDGQSLSNIVISYAKTQNGSEEFFRLLGDIISSKADILKLQDIAIITYSYGNNPNCTEKILEILQDVVKKNIYKFLAKELCSITRAYHMKKLLDVEMIKLVTEAFVQRHEEVNSLDLAYLYTILADTNNPRFLKYSHKCLENLFFTFSGSELGIISKKAEFMQKNNPNIYNIFKKQVEKLMAKESIKGFDLKEIHTNTKTLPFDTQYNTFRENVERHLEKLKYY